MSTAGGDAAAVSGSRGMPRALHAAAASAGADTPSGACPAARTCSSATPRQLASAGRCCAAVSTSSQDALCTAIMAVVSVRALAGTRARSMSLTNAAVKLNCRCLSATASASEKADAACCTASRMSIRAPAPQLSRCATGGSEPSSAGVAASSGAAISSSDSGAVSRSRGARPDRARPPAASACAVSSAAASWDSACCSTARLGPGCCATPHARAAKSDTLGLPHAAMICQYICGWTATWKARERRRARAHERTACCSRGQGAMIARRTIRDARSTTSSFRTLNLVMSSCRNRRCSGMSLELTAAHATACSRAMRFGPLALPRRPARCSFTAACISATGLDLRDTMCHARTASGTSSASLSYSCGRRPGWTSGAGAGGAERHVAPRAPAVHARASPPRHRCALLAAGRAM